MRRFDLTDIVMVVILVLTVSFIAFAVAHYNKTKCQLNQTASDRFDEKCRELGGIPQHGRNLRMCLQPNAIIEMP